MRWMVVILAALGLSACSGGEGGDGPDEFSVVPSLPLVQPENYAELPPPSPGAGNRADARPNADAAEALGGAIRNAGIPASDAGLVTFASRFGTDPAIRSALFEADEQFRDRRGRFGLFRRSGPDRYLSIYANQTLDAAAELARFRNAGVRVPTAPPVR